MAQGALCVFYMVRRMNYLYAHACSQQAAKCPGATSLSSGVFSVQIAMRCGQRSAKAQPWIATEALGTMPGMGTNFFSFCPSTGTDSSSPIVYGCLGS